MLIKVWSRIDQFEGRSALRSWVGTITRNQALTFHRRRESRKARMHFSLNHKSEWDTTNTSWEATECTIERDLLYAEKRQLVVRLLPKISPASRAAMQHALDGNDWDSKTQWVAGYHGMRVMRERLAGVV